MTLTCGTFFGVPVDCCSPSGAASDQATQDKWCQDNQNKRRCAGTECTDMSNGSFCKKNEDCFHYNDWESVCDNQKCVIWPTHSFKVGDKCSNDYDCQTSRCVSYRCRRNDGTCDAKMGQGINPDCPDGQVCSCPPNFQTCETGTCT
jgi:hypothetical protein